jgi:excisionase family DNA binding protein
LTTSSKAGFLILPKQTGKVASEPAGEKMMKTELSQLNSWKSRELLTVSEVAEWVRVHPKTVYRWIKDGRLEALQIGPRTSRVPEDAVEKFLHQAGYGVIPTPSGKNGKRQHERTHDEA